jgi:hypothetical protein
MIPEFCRSFETSTLMDLVSYGEPVDEEPKSEEWSSREEEASPRPSDMVPRRRSRSSLRRKKSRWSRLGRRLMARAGRP